MRCRRGDRPGESDALTLPAGDADPALADLRVEPVAKVGYLVFERGHADGPAQCRVVSLAAGGIERDVLSQRARKEQSVLREIADRRAPLGGPQLVDRCAGEQDRAGLDWSDTVGHAWHQVISG